MDYFSSFQNLLEFVSITITFLMVSIWFDIVFWNGFSQKINSNSLNLDENYFDSLYYLSDSIDQYKTFQAILIFLYLFKMMSFFILPKRTSILLQVMIMAWAYVLFFMTLFFFVINRNYFILLINIFLDDNSINNNCLFNKFW